MEWSVSKCGYLDSWAECEEGKRLFADVRHAYQWVMGTFQRKLVPLTHEQNWYGQGMPALSTLVSLGR